jgi:hypothetical protein
MHIKRVRQASSTPFPLLRTFLSILYRTSRFLFFNYSLIFIGLVLTIYSFAQNRTLGVIAIGVSLAAILVTFMVWYGTMRDYYIQPLAPVNVRKVEIPPALQASGYELLPRRSMAGDALLTSMRINRALFNGVSSELQVQKVSFRARHPAAVNHVLLREFTKKKGKVLFNAKKVRLLSDPLLDDNDSLVATRVQPTHYFDTLVTNDALGVSLRSKNNRAKVFDGHDFCFPSNIIPECLHSMCANQIGTSTIAFTSDDYLVVVGQGDANAFSGRLWAPSGSGSADWADVGQFTDLQKFTQFSARRELVEECGLTTNDVAWLRTIGYGRLLHRGGLPQFFFLAKLNCTYNKIRITKAERPLIDYHKSMQYGSQLSRGEAIVAAMKELRKSDTFLSSVLWWCFELLSLLPEESVEESFS